MEAAARERAIAAASQRAQAESHPGFDGENCVTCGEPIPPQRLALNRVRCVDCQTRIERGR